jgi:hypothetical protein
MVMTAEHESERSDVTHGDRTVVLVYLWSVAWHQGVSWACDPEHWCWGPFPATWPSAASAWPNCPLTSVASIAFVSTFKGNSFSTESIFCFANKFLLSPLDA